MKTRIKALNRKRNYAVKKMKILMRYKPAIWGVNIFKAKRKTPSLNSVKKVLLVRNDLIGDMVITTPLIRNLSANGFEVYVASKSTSLCILENNPYIKDVFHYSDKSIRDVVTSIKKVRGHNFDLVVDMKLSTSIFSILYCSFVKSPILIGFNKSNVKSYNISIPYRNADIHVTNSFEPLYKILNILEKDHKYDIYIPESVKIKTDELINQLTNSNKLHKKIAVFNPYGSKSERCLSNSQIESIFTILDDYTVILIGEYKKISKIKLPNNAIIYESNSIIEVFELINLANIVVSVDTAIVHIATALQSKAIAIYKESPVSTVEVIAEDEKLKKYKRELQQLAQDKPFLKSNNIALTKNPQSKLYSPNSDHAIQFVYECHQLDEVDTNRLKNDVTQAILSIG